MALPEHAFRLSEFRAPDKTGGESNGSTGLQHQQPIPSYRNLFSEMKPSLPSQENLITNINKARRSVQEQPGYIPRFAGGQDTKKSEGLSVIGRADFSWKRELSEDGKKLYKALLKEMGDRHLLPIYAAEDKFDLHAALDELRGHGLLDESDPEIIRIVGKKL